MKRIHIGLAVKDLAKSIQFYSDLFGAQPTVTKPDYAKWLLDEPPVNFSISTREGNAGAVHFGIQVDDEAALTEIAGRLRRAGREPLEEHQTTCCYHLSEKAWVVDPDRHAWETFYTHGEATVYGESNPALADGQWAR